MGEKVLLKELKQLRKAAIKNLYLAEEFKKYQI